MQKEQAPLLNVHVYGDKSLPTVVLLHGLMGSWRTWHAIIEALNGKYHFVAIDLLGFGESPKPRTSRYGKKEHVAALKQTLKHYGYERPHMIVGFSLGSVLATYLLKERGISTDRLLLISPPIYANKGEMSRRIKRSPTPAIFRRGPVAHVAHTVRRRSSYVTRMVARLTHPAVPSVVVDDLRKVPYYAYLRTRKRVLEKETVITSLPRVKLVSVIVGSHDIYADISHLGRLTQKKGTFDILPGKGHSLPFTAPDEIVKAISALSLQEKKSKTKLMRDL